MCEKYGIDDKTRFLVLYLDAHMDVSEISKIINRCLNTIYRWVSTTKKGEDIRLPKTRGGHNKLINEETETKIMQMIHENPEGTSLRKLAARIGLSKSTVGNVLSKMGLKYKGFDKGIIYTEEERMIRIDFCNRMLSDEGKLLYRTFFSDEMGIELFKAHKNKAWQFPTEKIKKKSAVENVKLDCWGAISARGATSLDIYKKGMKGDLYRRIIESHKEEMERLYADGDFFFIQDNHPTHRMNEEWMIKEQKIELIKLPTRSSDLNIIENLWLAMKERVKSDAPTNEKEMRESLVKNWEILTKPDRMQRFFEGLHRKYMECIAKEGVRLK